jgi:hypothetical protein
MTDQDHLMLEGKARWLLEGGIEKLDEDERALLLALVSLEVGTGRAITADEQAALDQIVERTGMDGEEITRAVKHMVEAKPTKPKKLDWSDLKRRLRRQ